MLVFSVNVTYKQGSIEHPGFHILTYNVLPRADVMTYNVLPRADVMTYNVLPRADGK